MTREEWQRVEEVLHKPEVRLAMMGRCEEQDHQWENCCSMFMQLYEQCKWCGARK